jgi:hypothetical protein
MVAGPLGLQVTRADISRLNWKVMTAVVIVVQIVPWKVMTAVVIVVQIVQRKEMTAVVIVGQIVHWKKTGMKLMRCWKKSRMMT